MKKNLFKRLLASAMTLAMLLPCLMTAPASAAGEATELFKWTAAGETETSMTQVKDNIVRGTSRSSTHWTYNLNANTADGVKNYLTYYIRNNATADYGLPAEVIGSKTKATEGLKLQFTEFTPTPTTGLEAVNLKMIYALNTNLTDTPVFALDEFEVLVSLDGKTWLEEPVGMRSWELIGHAKDSSNRDVYFFEIESEDFFNIDGLEPGDRIADIMIRPHGQYYYTFGYFAMNSVTVNGYSTKADFEAAVPNERNDLLYIGEDTMRDIVVEHGLKTSELAWVSDATIYDDYSNQGMDYSVYVKYAAGVTWHGPLYARTLKPGLELFDAAVVDGKYVVGGTGSTAWGMDCMVYAYDCYSRISRSHSWVIWQTQSDNSLKLLGNLKTDESPTYTNSDIIPLNDAQTMYEAYALMEKGDIMTTYTTGTAIHIRIAQKDAVVVRNADGTIDPNKSYVTVIEQGSVQYFYFTAPDGSIVYVKELKDLDGVAEYEAAHPGYKFQYASVTRHDWDYTFKDMLDTYYVPLTLEEYEAGAVENVDVQSVMGPKDYQDISNGFRAILASDYHIGRVIVKLEDLSQNTTLFEDTMLGNNTQTGNPPHQRNYAWLYESDKLDTVLAGLTNGAYRISVSPQAGPVTQARADRPMNTQTYDFTITDKAPAAAVTIIPAASSVTKGQTFDVGVNVNTGYDAADVEVKFDTNCFQFVSGEVSAYAALEMVEADKGIVRIMAAGAGAGAGQLAKLTFKAITDTTATDAFELKSAAIGTAADASSSDADKALDRTEACASLRMGDVSKDAWYHDAVDYVLDNGIMGGYNTSTFGPNDTLSRAMVVQVLYNKEGQRPVTVANKFPDVSANDWFYNAVRWGADKGVVGGYGNGHFGPNDNVTIEQVAVILWNYSGNPTPTGDAGSVGTHSDWAANALSWAVANGILENVPVDSVMNPATRAQTAQMLMNYLDN